MPKIIQPSTLVQPAPSSVWAYTDRLTYWLREPLRPNVLDYLDGYCGRLDIRTRPMMYDSRYRQRLQLCQPKTAALRTLSKLAGMLTYLEVSLDWIFKTERQCDHAFEFLDTYYVKSHHQRQRVSLSHGTTRYSAEQGSPNVLAIYTDRPCKLTGETPCVHLDWRMSGRSVIANAGIASPADLIDFDHRAFWQPRLNLYALRDLQTLGRRHNNTVFGTRRRSAWIEVSPDYDFLHWNHDKRLGRIILTLCDNSLQTLVDRFAWFQVRQCLSRFDVSDLLPELEGTLAL
jgi:hypothetical protein